MISLPQYEIFETLYNRENRSVYRARSKSSRQSVIIKVDEGTAPGSNNRLKKEYELLRSFDHPNVLKAYEYHEDRQYTAIVLEDFEAVSLREFIAAQKASFQEILKVSLKICQGLQYIHSQGIVHMDLHPGNLLVNPVSLETKICDFGQTIWILDDIEEHHTAGTLFYAAPEQTGRINQPIDGRSNLYSLGVILYEWVTGHLPFANKDLLSLVHAIIAREPLSPLEYREYDRQNYAPVFSEIITRLLAKYAEQRYQTAGGLAHDFSQLLALAQKKKSSDPWPDFTPGQHDISEQLHLPHSLISRSPEYETLINNFDATLAGQLRILFVSGEAGTGKTFLVQQLQREVFRRNGYFITGRFDSSNGTRLYTAIVEALRDLLRQVLTKSEQEIENIRDLVEDVLGENVAVLGQVLPEIISIGLVEKKISHQSATEDQNRFQSAFLNFIQIFCRPETPLVLVLDNLHQADLASLRLLEKMAAMKGHFSLFLVGILRSAVDEQKVLSQFFSQLDEKKIAYSGLQLAPFGQDEILLYLKETVWPLADAEELARLLWQKTAGNPFTVREFLTDAYQNQLLQVDFGRQQWVWNKTALYERPAADNVASLLVRRLGSLSAGAMELLQLASCLGSVFRVTDLAALSGQGREELAKNLSLLDRQGYILPVISALGIKDGGFVSAMLPAREITFKFVHDLLSETVFASLSDADKNRIFRSIAEELQKKEQADSDHNILELAKYWNLVTDKSDEENALVRRYNILAGNQSRRAVAFENALAFFRQAECLTTEQHWQSDYDQTYALFLGLGETAFLSSRPAEAEHYFQIIRRKARRNIDIARMLQLQTMLYVHQSNLPASLAAGIEALSLLGVSMQAKSSPLAVARELLLGFARSRGKKISSLAHLPVIESPEVDLQIEILVSLMSSAFAAGGQNTFGVVVLKILNISLKYGNRPGSGFGYGGFGVILNGVFKNEKRGSAFGGLQLVLAEKFNQPVNSGQLLFGYAVMHMCWVEPVANSFAIFERGIQTSYRAGDFIYTSYSQMSLVNARLWLGQNLQLLGSELENFRAFSAGVGFADTELFFRIVQSACNQLADKQRLSAGFFDEKFSQQECVTRLEQVNNDVVKMWYHLYRLKNAMFFGETALAAEQIDDLQKYVQQMISQSSFVEYSFLSSLHALRSGAKGPGRRRVNAALANFRRWSKNCPQNFEHMLFLLQAALAEKNQKFQQAELLYNQAIDAAQNNGFLLYAAYYCELAAGLQQQRNQSLQRMYLTDAVYLYGSCKAAGKAFSLLQKYPAIFTRLPQLSSMSSGERGSSMVSSASSYSHLHNSELLNLTTVIKISQLLADELSLESLLRKAMDVILSNTGAQYACLVMNKKDQLLVEAYANVAEEKIEVLQGVALRKYNKIAVSPVFYVYRTGQPLIIDDAREAHDYARDPYFHENFILSLCVMPIKYQNNLVGILYLENRSLPDVFSGEQFPTLEFLCSQIAISIESANLYQELDEKVKERTREVEAQKELLQKKNNELAKDLVMASKIQQSLLPRKLPVVERLEVFFHYLPVADVGGDFIDYQTDTEGGLGIFMCDVSGHGVPAALIASMVKMSLQNWSSTLKNPALSIAQVHENMLGKLAGNFVTACICYIDTRNSKLRLASAGHPPLVILSADGSAVTCNPPGPAIFDFPKLKYGEMELDLKPGDKIIIYTDGIIETENRAGEMLGEEGFIELLKQKSSLSANDLGKYVISYIKEFSARNEEFDDDITLSIVEFR